MGLIRICILSALIFVSAKASSAEPMICGHARSESWRDGMASADLLIRNDDDEELSLVWIKEDGSEEEMASVAPHGVTWQPSYDGHAWALKSARGDCLCALRLRGKTRWVRGAGVCEESTIGPYEETAKYQVKKIEGWRVLVSSAFAAHPAQRHAAIDALRADLAQIRKRNFTRSALAQLRTTKIWLEYTDPLYPVRAGYHPYAEFLAGAGMNPAKLRSVQFTARSLEARNGQPALVLHELAHAFHDQVLGYDDPELLAAYFRSCSDERLHKVERTPGYPERHYGLTDQTEYFAEFSEAFFWDNDYPPKEHDALKAFDASIAGVIDRSWKKPRAPKVHLGAPHQVCPKKQ